MCSHGDVDAMIETLRNCEFLREAEVRMLCNRAKEIIIDESNVQRVDAPVTVRLCLLGDNTGAHWSSGGLAPLLPVPCVPSSCTLTPQLHPH